MSNALAIAAVTSTLRFLLDRALQQPHPGPVGGAVVTTLRPHRLTDSDLVSAPGLNVYLYSVSPNHAITDLPTRRGDGTPARRPSTALDLHYLLTCHGEDPSLDAQRLLGRAVTALAATPVLSHSLVAAAVAAYGSAPDTAFLTDTDLTEQLELVKLSPAVLSLEELSKLWSVFLQTPYELSLAYTATVVLLEADATPHTALPVRERVVSITAADPPQLDAVDTDPPGGAVTAGTRLLLRGSGLLGDDTRVRIGPVRLAPERASPRLVTAVVGDAVPAGLHSVQVEHAAAASTTVPVLVRPVVTVGEVGAGAVTLMLRPPLVTGQRATVTLTRLGDGDPATVSLPLPPATEPSVALPRSDVPDGTWLVRVQVDGAESLPELVGDVYAAPALTLPPP